MATDNMVKEAWEEFLLLHEDAKRVYLNSKKYQRLFAWLSQTFELFPERFEGITNSIPRTMPDFVPGGLPIPEPLVPATDGDSQIRSLRLSRLLAASSMEDNKKFVNPPALSGVALSALPVSAAGFARNLPSRVPMGEYVTEMKLDATESGIAARRKLNDIAVQMVEMILRERGPLRLEDIIQVMKEKGWKGYPLDDPRQLYNALQARARTGDQFLNQGNNTWSLKEGS